MRLLENVNYETCYFLNPVAFYDQLKNDVFMVSLITC